MTTKRLVLSIDDADASLLDGKWEVSLIFHKDGVSSLIPLKKVIASRMIGRELKDGEYVIHTDFDKFNFSRDNLQLVDRAHAYHHKRLTAANTSGYKGVSWHKHNKRWRAQIMKNNQAIHIGYFDTADDAAIAYNNAAVELYGDAATLNEVTR